jgi:hypothetical protein
MYKGAADWAPIAAVKNNPRMHIPVFGNGDVNTPNMPYPVKLEFINVVIVLVTILFLGGMASKIAATRVTKKLIT